MWGAWQKTAFSTGLKCSSGRGLGTGLGTEALLRQEVGQRVHLVRTEPNGPRMIRGVTDVVGGAVDRPDDGTVRRSGRACDFGREGAGRKVGRNGPLRTHDHRPNRTLLLAGTLPRTSTRTLFSFLSHWLCSLPHVVRILFWYCPSRIG